MIRIRIRKAANLHRLSVDTGRVANHSDDGVEHAKSQHAAPHHATQNSEQPEVITLLPE